MANPAIRSELRFILNGEDVRLTDVQPDLVSCMPGDAAHGLSG